MKPTKTEKITNDEKRLCLVMGILLLVFYMLSCFDILAKDLPKFWSFSGMLIGCVMIWFSQ